ncbi:MAG: hypothetical protein BVN35_20185 [Proteobacteria bacterium ST_bin11]|nr:MAG: hypothetical protein BVN35_20185 [Proteobacteria bacterium ST_bin11]
MEDYTSIHDQIVHCQGKEQEEEEAKPSAEELRKIAFNGVAVLSVALIYIATLFHYLGGTEKHFNTFGPNDNLYILNVQINTWFRFFVALLSIGLTYAARSFVKSTLGAYLKFSVFNVYQQTIRGFSKTGFVLLAGFVTFVDELIQLLSLSILLSQLDFIIFGNSVHAIVVMLTVYRSLKTKKVIR